MSDHEIASRYVVSGGSGFIGRALVAALVARGSRVVVLSRRPEHAGGLGPGTRAVAWDGATLGDWADELQGASGVVHLAGENIGGGLWTRRRKRRILDSRVQSTQALVAACGQVSSPPPVFVQASGVDYYGSSGDRVMHEDDSAGEGFLAEVVRAWEGAGADVEAHGVRWVALRSGMVLAADGGALPLMARPFRAFLGGRVGDGRQWVSWIHRSDLVAGIQLLLQREVAQGPYNLVSPEPVTNGDFSRQLALALRRPCWLPAPAFALRLLLGEMSSLLLDGQRALPRKLQELGFEFRFPNLGSALSDLFAGVAA